METRLEANFDHDNDQFWIKTKQLVGRMTAQPNNRFVFCVVVVKFAVNRNQALDGTLCVDPLNKIEMVYCNVHYRFHTTILRLEIIIHSNIAH